MLNSAPEPFDSTISTNALRAELVPEPAPLRAAITAAYRRDEREAVRWLHTRFKPDERMQTSIQSLAERLVTAVREKRTKASGVDALMHEFSLSSEEGVALMCLAEALLRIPDHETVDRLIADKISKGDWKKHLGESPSLFVNAATWGLLVTGKLVGTSSETGLGTALTRLIAKGGEPLIRKGVDLAMRMLGNQFVTGQTIEEALINSRERESRGYRYSYDMLGEAALTEEDATRYYAAYENAIHAIGRAAHGRGLREGPGISVKLSALHPRYVRAQRERVFAELLPRLKTLLMLAKEYGIGLNIDAEEADRLELSLDLMHALAVDQDLQGFDGIGFVVQAYQKRCPFVIDYLADLARQTRRKFMVRLVKGAYWDAEIKRAQTDGMPDYPVYTRKIHTDLSYLVCAQKLLDAGDAIYPQFATHNAHTLASIYVRAQHMGVTDYEFQCLHGMGEALYDQVVGPNHLNKACRIYAPVGSHETLLAYLVRRLLENGANSSFVSQVVDENIPLASLIADPFEAVQKTGGAPHSAIPAPPHLYGATRLNSTGLDLSNEHVLHGLYQAFTNGPAHWEAIPLTGHIADTAISPPLRIEIRNPADHRDIVGLVREASESEAEHALTVAASHALRWQNLPYGERASILVKAADLLEQHQSELMALAIREAGKSLPNAIAEVREAVDFLRYYAAEIRQAPFSEALGPVVCISPWNFPLAIFIGEVSAALAAGNVVLAKPAEQTPLIAGRAVALLHEAGVPRGVLQYLPGRGETVGARLVADARVRGVIFTGSTEVAQIINRTLSRRRLAEGSDIPLIAETGGQNALIVDSSALPEQVVQDVITSAFDSAGQRCSALRLLCLQTDIADKTLGMLKGAMKELRIGNPGRLSTDVGPVIDVEARQNLLHHIDDMKEKALDFFQLPLPADCREGTFVAPTVIEIASISDLTQEVFGPVLHVIRYQRNQLGNLIKAINGTGYGLTLGIHSRIDETIAFVTEHAHVGNIYVNRNIVGAVVGVQPFGGEGKSGTGPKAGGPLYLKRLQRTPSITRGSLSDHSGAPDVSMTQSAFGSLFAWAGLHGHEQLRMLAENYAKDSLLHTRLALPGPTGERNTLSFFARGKVLCDAAETATLLNQLAAVLATGNTPVLTAKALPRLPSGLPQAVRAMIEPDGEHGASSLKMALSDASGLSEVVSMLASNDAALIPVIEVNGHDAIPLWRLVAERAVCINTTAAGGNASLMMLHE